MDGLEEKIGEGIERHGVEWVIESIDSPLKMQMGKDQIRKVVEGMLGYVSRSGLEKGICRAIGILYVNVARGKIRSDVSVEIEHGSILEVKVTEKIFFLVLSCINKALFKRGVEVRIAYNEEVPEVEEDGLGVKTAKLKYLKSLLYYWKTRKGGEEVVQRVFLRTGPLVSDVNSTVRYYAVSVIRCIYNNYTSNVLKALAAGNYKAVSSLLMFYSIQIFKRKINYDHIRKEVDQYVINGILMNEESVTEGVMMVLWSIIYRRYSVDREVQEYMAILSVFEKTRVRMIVSGLLGEVAGIEVLDVINANNIRSNLIENKIRNINYFIGKEGLWSRREAEKAAGEEGGRERTMKYLRSRRNVEVALQICSVEELLSFVVPETESEGEGVEGRTNNYLITDRMLELSTGQQFGNYKEHGLSVDAVLSLTPRDPLLKKNGGDRIIAGYLKILSRLLDLEQSEKEKRVDWSKHRASIKDTLLHTIKKDTFPIQIHQLFKHKNISLIGSDISTDISKLISRTTHTNINNTALLLSPLLHRDNTSLTLTLYAAIEETNPTLTIKHLRFILPVLLLTDKTQRPIDLLLSNLNNYTTHPTFGDLGSYVREHSIHTLLTLNGYPSDITINRNATVNLDKHLIRLLLDKSTRLSHSLIDRLLSSPSLSPPLLPLLHSYQENIATYSKEESLLRATLSFITRHPQHTAALSTLSTTLHTADGFTHNLITSLLNTLPNKEKITSLIKNTK